MTARTIALALLLGLALAGTAKAYERPTLLNEVARHYSLGVGEVRCISPAERESDPLATSRWGYTNVRLDVAVLAPHVCEGASGVARTEVPAWQRAVGTLVLVHEAFHLRHWRHRRDEAKVECQAIVYFIDAARSLAPARPRRRTSIRTRSPGTGTRCSCSRGGATPPA